MRRYGLCMVVLLALLFGCGRAADEAYITRKPKEPPKHSGKEPLELDLGGGVQMKLVWIPAGEFMMGSPNDERGRRDIEERQHRVRITKGLYMGATEVTQAQYKAVMGNNPAHFKGDNNPVETVSWTDAVEFCKKLSQRTKQAVRLPTEAEWEYACRAGTTTPFHFGETIPTGQVNYDGRTTHVGSFSANALGLYDMHGNVCEWCADWYDKDYYQKSPADDPQGPPAGKGRVTRGGSYIYFVGGCRSAYRGDGMLPTHKSDAVGFRVVLTAPE